MITNQTPWQGTDQIQKKVGLQVVQAGRFSVKSPACGSNWALETEEYIENQKEGGREIDNEHQNGG